MIKQQTNQLPNPDSDSQHHCEIVLDAVLKKIEKNGPLPFSDYMNMTLYEPGLGYYATGARKFGEGGDFITAPELSALFSQCLAKQCEQVLSEIGYGDILEFGAGSGKMAYDTLTSLLKINSAPKNYYILEISPELRDRQQHYLKKELPDYFENIIWLDELPQSFNGVMLANEILDAFPTHIFKKQKTIKEFYVTHKAKKLEWLLHDATENLIESVLNLNINFDDDYQSEINMLIAPWIKSIAESIDQGALFIIDYGYPRKEYYHPDRHMGTLMCHFRHHSHPDPLVYPGIQDITAHIDFTAVAEAAEANHLNLAGYSNQASFLISCGLTELLADMTPGTEEYYNVTQHVKMLTLPSEMGEIFKCMALTKKMKMPLIGFRMKDDRHKL